MNKGTRLRLAGAAAGALALAAIGFASPGYAHDEGKAGDHDRVEKIIVITNHDDRDRAGRDSRDRGPRVRAFGMDGMRVMDCGDSDRTVTESSDNGERTRIVLCSRGEANPARRVERLEQALGRIASSGQLTAEQKERVTAALREAIERLRTTP
jgi:hypothetical protein